MGFREAGFDILWANDADKHACETHSTWSGSEIICAKVEDLKVDSLPHTDIIVGGFPCQGFSMAGPRKIDDSRNLLYKYFVECIESIKPKIFVAENVKGIITMGKGSIIRAIVYDFEEKGYDVQVKLLNSADYGVPQDRLRVIIVGVEKGFGKDFEYPEPCYFKVTMKDCIGHLPEPEPEDVCENAYSSRYMSRQRARGWDRQSFTIPAMAKQVPLHPSSPPMEFVRKDVMKFGEGKSRRLSWREAALIQTFPESIEFCGDLTSKYRQIGNAVPVNLAKCVAKSVKECLSQV